jgi:hypothetical protein
MDRQLIDRLETFVKNEGFTQVDIVRSTNSQTLSATQGETRLVVHVTDDLAVPFRAEVVRDTPSELIAVRPIVPGVTEAITGGPGRSGAGGGVGHARPPAKD